MEIPDLIKKSQEIRAQSPNSRRLRWRKEFRQIVVTMVNQGESILKISQGTGIAHQTIRGWARGSLKKFRQVKVMEAPNAEELVLRWQEGFEIRGLAFEQLAHLLREGLL